MKTLRSFIASAFVISACQLALAEAAKVIAVHPITYGDATASESELFAELVRTELGNNDDLAVVDRARLQSALGELSISGVTADGGVKLGGLLGANYLAEAKIATLDGQRMALVKVIDVASTRSRSARASLPADASRLDAAAAVAEKMTELLARFGRDQAPAQELPVIAPVPADAPRPVVAVCIPEEVLFTRVPDPAAEVKTTALLIENGFRVIDIPTAHASLKIADGAALRAEGSGGALGLLGKGAAPTEGKVGDDSPLMGAMRVARERGVDVLIYGEGLAEAGARMGGLATSRARVEIRAVDTRTGEVIFSRSASAGAGDASGAVAAKAALEKAAHHIAAKLIPALVARASSTPAKTGK